MAGVGRASQVCTEALGLQDRGLCQETQVEEKGISGESALPVSSRGDLDLHPQAVWSYPGFKHRKRGTWGCIFRVSVGKAEPRGVCFAQVKG